MVEPKKNIIFARELAKLNPRQREAVETIDGPVMVLAGPGTGKTQVVAMRIGQILTSTQVTARNILALTFTDAGVTALRQRLITIIGPDAYQVTISTFHGFTNEIISTFPYAFELPVTTENLDELEQYQLVDQLVKTTPNLSLLRPARVPTYHVPAIIKAIKTLKQEAISPAELIKLATTESKSNVAKTKTEAELERHRLIVLEELAIIYRRYEAMLRTDGLYDYDDMILLVLQAMTHNLEIKQFLQERYQYILVDEYQDTNNSQNELVETLADFFDKPNLCVVGDDKQAIYRFQGASVANMLHFAKKYPAIKIVALTENYRNPASVLKAASNLIDNNGHQLGTYLKINHPLSAVSTNATQPRLITLPSKTSQFGWIVKACQERINQGVDASQIAVLCRSNREVQEIRYVAEAMNLDVAGIQSVDLLAEPEIKAYLAVLRAINQPIEPTSVLAALPYLAPEVTAIEISMALKGNTKGRPVLDWLASGQRRQPNVAQAAKNLRQLILCGQRAHLIDLIYQIIDRTGASQINDSNLAIDRLEIVQAFLIKVNQLISRQADYSIDQLLQYFETFRAYKINLPVKRATPERQGVFVATVHGAKGLEFETVFMPSVTTDNCKVRASRSMIKLPETITGLANWREDQLEDERRLFYVGLTRAKKELILTASEQSDDGRPLLPSQFVFELGDNLQSEKIELAQLEVADLLNLLLKRPDQSSLNRRQLTYIREQVSTKPISYTHFRAYLTCPRQYLLRHVLKLPEVPNYSLIYGSAIHKALELYFKEYQQTKVKPKPEKLIQAYQEAISRELSGNELSSALTKGSALLTEYWTVKSPNWLMPVGVEYSFYTHRVESSGIWLTGKFDRIEPIDPIGRTVRIIDYKTSSRPKTRGQIEGTTQDSDGEIKAQLVFYALLAERDRVFPFNAREFMISSVDDSGKFTDEVFKITNEEIIALDKTMATTYQEILSCTNFSHTRAEFDRGCELCRLL